MAHQEIGRLRANQRASGCPVLQAVVAQPAPIKIFDLKGRGRTQNGVKRPFKRQHRPREGIALALRLIDEGLQAPGGLLSCKRHGHA